MLSILGGSSHVHFILEAMDVLLDSSTHMLSPFFFSQTYAVNVDKYCIGHKCTEGAGFQALVDTGTSFTSLPLDAYKSITMEFDKQINASRASSDDYSFEYCYSTG
jgi:hypothetical protein